MKNASFSVLLLAIILIAAFVIPCDAAMPIYTFGETGASLGTCFCVGNGRYLVTTADNVIENLGPTVRRSMKYAIVVSPLTGDILEARVIKVDEPGNLALLKLEEDITLPAVAFEKSPKQLPYATLGQLVNDAGSLGANWPTIMKSYRVEKDKSSGRTIYVLSEWKGKLAFISESKGHRWLFLSEVTPSDKAPGGGPVLMESGNAVGVYVSRLIIESGSKTDELRLCVPVTETIKFLEGAGLNRDELYNPPKNTTTKTEGADEAFQCGWRALTNVAGANWASAVSDAKAYSEIKPNSSQALLLYGVALIGAGKHSEALKPLDAAIKLNPELAGAYLNRGIACGAMNQRKESEQDLRKAAKLDAEDIESRIWLSRLLVSDAATRAEAVKIAEEAIKISPDSLKVLLNYASALMASQQYEKSSEQLKKALEISPNFLDARAALAEVYKAWGRMDDAEAEYRALVKEDPKNPAALLELAAFLIEEDKKEEAKQLISDVLRSDPAEQVKNAAEDLKKKLE